MRGSLIIKLLAVVLVSSSGCTSPGGEKPAGGGPRTLAGMTLYLEGDLAAHFQKHRMMVTGTAFQPVKALPDGGWSVMTNYPSVNYSHTGDARGESTLYPHPVTVKNSRGVPVDPMKLDNETLLVLEQTDKERNVYELVGTAKGEGQSFFGDKKELHYKGPG